MVYCTNIDCSFEQFRQLLQMKVLLLQESWYLLRIEAILWGRLKIGEVVFL